LTGKVVAIQTFHIVTWQITLDSLPLCEAKSYFQKRKSDSVGHRPRKKEHDAINAFYTFIHFLMAAVAYVSSTFC
jgi:hypothetical protein